MGLNVSTTVQPFQQGLPNPLTNLPLFPAGERRANPEYRILSGELANTTFVPYIIGLGRTRDNYLFCGGSIISSLWILTAAHCVQLYKTNPKWIKVTAGNVHRWSPSFHKQERQVEQIIIHEKYEYHFARGGYDIALLKLKDPLVFNKYVSRISLPENGIEDWKGFGRVSGWGRLHENGRVADQLRTLEVPIVSSSNCSADYEWQFGYNISSTMVCAGGEGGKDSCQGDSGGPLTCKNNTVLCGIVSFGEGCGILPGVYTDVSYYKEWIDYNMNNLTATTTTAGFPATATTGSPITLTAGSPTNETAGSPTSATAGSLTSATAGSPTSATAGSPTTTTTGSPTTVIAGSPTITNTTILLAPVVNKELKCGSEYFYCWEDHRCISRKLLCDGKKGCSSGSDEAVCIKRSDNWDRNNDFVCNNGKTIHYYFFCDGENNCGDDSDESKCDFRDTCEAGQFRCLSDGRCIHGSWSRDGVVDCDDGSDEDNYKEMPNNLTDILKTCIQTSPAEFKKGQSIANNRDYFLCRDSHPLKCIPNHYVCDGKWVSWCPNGEDQRDCPSTSYDRSNFHCRNGKSVPRSRRCDGKEDCDDKSDEINCYQIQSTQHSFKLPDY